MSNQEINQKIEGLREELSNIKGTECGVFQRVTGYYRATRNWNEGKAEEYKQRRPFSVPSS
jgi:anaerobic ribonucleoside-triphosphate reductase